MYSTTIFVEYNENYFNEVKMIKDVIAIHRRGKKIIVLTKTYQVLFENKDVRTIHLVERTDINSQNYNGNFDVVFDCPLKPNFYEEDKS